VIIPEGPLAERDFDYHGAHGGRSRPGVPKLRMGSGRLLLHSARRLRQTPPTAVVAAMVPLGRGSLDRVGEMIGAVNPTDGWSPHPTLWVVAMDYDSGRRVPFGRDGSPAAALADAVTASCAIPGWFAPVTISGRRYVDGGACSATNADLAAGLDLDELYVLAPMASFSFDQPASVVARLERGWRRRVSRRLLNEVRKVRDEGAEVRVLAPGPDDLTAIGANVMDASRRLQVLDVSLRTSVTALQEPVPDDLPSAG
jgi:NTE family protein